MAKKKTETEKKEITPSQYFDYLKDAKQNITNEQLKDSYSSIIQLAEKYKKLGQKESLKKLVFLSTVLEKEEKLIELGVTTFVYRDKIEDYIDTVASNAVKIVELSRYMREVPDDLVDVVDKTRDLFDEFYVVFTDYTGKEERKVEKERRDKDPILFGVFKNAQNVADRFYFLGDWVDDYCDLTIDKLVSEYKSKKGKNPQLEISVPQSAEELVGILSTMTETNEANVIQNPLFNDDMVISHYTVDNEIKKNTSLFKKVRSIFGK